MIFADCLKRIKQKLEVCLQSPPSQNKRVHRASQYRLKFSIYRPNHNIITSNTLQSMMSLYKTIHLLYFFS